MLTFLDTAAPPPSDRRSSDRCRPTSTVTPNPSDGLDPGHRHRRPQRRDDRRLDGRRQAEFVVDDAVTTGARLRHADDRHLRHRRRHRRDRPRITAPRMPRLAGRRQAHRLRRGPRRAPATGAWSARRSSTCPRPVRRRPTDRPRRRPANGTRTSRSPPPATTRAAGGTITAAEYFLDTAGANGTGTAMSTQPHRGSGLRGRPRCRRPTVQALDRGHSTTSWCTARTRSVSGDRCSTSTLPVDHTGPSGRRSQRSGPTRPTACSATRATPATSWSRHRSPTATPASGLQSTVVDAEGFLDPTAATPAGGTGLQLVAVDGSLDCTTRDGLRTHPAVAGQGADGRDPPRVRPRQGRGRQLGRPLFGHRPGGRQDGARARSAGRPPRPTRPTAPRP